MFGHWQGAINFYYSLKTQTMYKRFSDPYRTTARFKSFCASCHKVIVKGDSIIYDKMRRLVYCERCGAEILRGVQAEKSMEQYGTDIY